MRRAFALMIAVALFASAALAEDAFYSVPLKELTVTEGELRAEGSFRSTGLDRRLRRSIGPYAVLDGAGEIFLDYEYEGFSMRQSAGVFYENTSLVIRVPEARDITGRLYVPKGDEAGETVEPDGAVMERLSFKVPANAADPEARKAFYQAKQRHYERLKQRGIPGAAWFRRQEDEARKALTGVVGAEPGAVAPVRPRVGDLEDTYAVFTGGRALSENLQLDRTLAVSAEGEADVDVASIEGISVQEMDWAPLIEGLDPEKDPLAAVIPADQHALFFPTFQAMLDTMDEAAANGTPVLRLMDTRAEDERSRERYERQLCMRADALSRLIGPHVIASVAFTGSDTYLPTGTDVAVLYEAKDPAALTSLLIARRNMAVRARPDAVEVRGEVAGVAYTGARTPDRAICSYLATMGDNIVVTNSLEQLRAIAETAQGKRPPLASLPEYTFFRNRYARGDKDETAFLILSDAAIRRWCGPRWRIGASRRTRAAALMSVLQAENVDEIARGVAAVQELTVNVPGLNLGTVRLTRAGVASSAYGTLEFLTPIAEMPLTTVTKAEADAYNRWRSRYQRNWRRYFDPIAVRFSLTPDTMAADVTVMPLIEGSDYGQIIEVVSGAKIAPAAGDPHEGALLHFAMAINKDSRLVRPLGSYLPGMAPELRMNPLGWLGESIAIYIDG